MHEPVDGAELTTQVGDKIVVAYLVYDNDQSPEDLLGDCMGKLYNFRRDSDTAGDGLNALGNTSYGEPDLDRVWNNSVYDTADYFQRLFGFQSNISAVFYLWNIQTKALLFLEQLNYKVTYNDSENYSIGGGFIEVSANVINNLNLTLGLNNHLTKKIETSVRNDIYKIGIDCENLFSFITPDISSAFHIESDSSSSNLKRIGISSGIKMMIKDFVFATSLEWNIIHNENPVNYISVHSNMRYDF